MRSIQVVCSFVLTAAVGVSGQGQEASKPAGDIAQGAGPVVTLEGHKARVTSLVFSPDGRRVVSASSKDVRTWDLATGKEVESRAYAGGQVVALFPDGGRMVVASSGNKVWPGRLAILDVADGKERAVLDPHGEWDRSFPFSPAIGTVVVSPDGKRFAMGGSIAKVGGPHGYPGGVVTIRDAETGEVIHRFVVSSHVGTLAFRADGKYLVGGTTGAGGELPESGEVWVWEVATGKAVRTFKAREDVQPGDPNEQVTSVDLSPDGKRVAASPGDVIVWDLATGKAELSLRAGETRIWRVAFSPDGKWLATGGWNDPFVRLWDATRGEERMAVPLGIPEAGLLVFSPDGRHLAVGGSARDETNAIRVWAVPGGERRPPADAK